MTAAEVLRAGVIGTWRLESYESRDLAGRNAFYPLGPDAQGSIVYTADGYMSAHLMRSDRAPFNRDDPPRARDERLAAAARGYIGYSGPFEVVDDGLLAHHVAVSLLPNWVGGTQYRTARLDGFRLELSPTEPIVIRGEHRNATFTWTRVGPR
jgi:Lipocalin-like domain